MEDSVGEEVKEEGEEMSHTKDTEATRSARHLWPNFIWIFRVTMDGGAWWAAVHGVAKSWTRLSEFPFTFHVHALEKEMATHSNVLFFFPLQCSCLENPRDGGAWWAAAPPGVAQSWTRLK